jgi:hypothetical protein
MKKLFLITPIILLTITLHSKTITDANGCSSKELTKMKPSYPNTSYQGFGITGFDINKEGKPENISSLESQCIKSRNTDKSLNYMKCGFFKSVSVNATKYFTYSPPKDKNGNSCSIKKHSEFFKYSFYQLEGDEYILRGELRKKQEEKNFETKEYPGILEEPIVQNIEGYVRYPINKGGR